MTSQAAAPRRASQSESDSEDTEELLNTPLEERVARLGPSPFGPLPRPGPHTMIVLYDTHTVTIPADPNAPKPTPVQKKKPSKKR